MHCIHNILITKNASILVLQWQETKLQKDAEVRMKIEGSDNGLPSSSRGPWKTVRMRFCLQKYCKPVVAEKISTMKNCLYELSILSSRRVPQKPVSYSNGRKEVTCCSDLTALLCCYSHTHILETAPLHQTSVQLGFPPQPAHQAVKPLRTNELILSSY